MLLLAHGGGFFAGSKSDMTKFAEQFVKKGYVVISIDYRLRDNPVTNWSAAVDDAMDDLGNAFDWIIDHSEDYHIDPKRIAIGGESAGGELTLSFINAGPQIWQNRDKSRVFAVINLYGPMSKVNEIDSADPPILFIHGTEDRTISYNETVKMVDLHRSKGVYTELFTMEGEGHGTDKYWSDVVFEMTQFLHN
ncbi:Lipase 2 [compost metagenome]